jgi:hypothetical protein
MKYSTSTPFIDSTPTSSWNLDWMVFSEFWNKNITGWNVTIANIDTGVDYNIPVF